MSDESAVPDPADLLAQITALRAQIAELKGQGSQVVYRCAWEADRIHRQDPPVKTLTAAIARAKGRGKYNRAWVEKATFEPVEGYEFGPDKGAAVQACAITVTELSADDDA